VLRRPDLASRMVGWAVELSKYNIQCEARESIKAQCLADFVNELVGVPDLNEGAWILSVDGSSNGKGGGADIVLQGPNNLLLEQSLRFGLKPSNNQAEYEVLIACLLLAADTGAKVLTCKTDSQLVVGHLEGTFQVKDPLLLRYYHVVQSMMSKFRTASVTHVSRSQNFRADLLSKLATAKLKGQHRTMIHATLNHPTVTLVDSNAIEGAGLKDVGWMTPII